MGNYAGAAARWAEMLHALPKVPSIPGATVVGGAFKEAAAEAVGVSISSQVQLAGRGRAAVILAADLFRADAPLADRINLEHVRVLSASKIGAVPNKGKNKNKSKKGKSMQGKGKGKSTGSFDGPGRQECRAVYLGQEGYIVCTLAFGADVERIPENPVGLSVDMVGLKPRGGQIGVLYWDAQTQLVKRLEQYDRNVPRSFPYDTTEVSNDLATFEFIQTA